MVIATLYSSPQILFDWPFLKISSLASSLQWWGNEMALSQLSSYVRIYKPYLLDKQGIVPAVGMYWTIGSLQVTRLTWLRCPQTPNHGLSQHCSSEPRPLPVQQSPSALPQSSWASFFVPLVQTLFRMSPCPECAPWSSRRTSRRSIDKQIHENYYNLLPRSS